MEKTTEKAKAIATKWRAKGLPYNAIYDAVLEAMQWKDEQFRAVIASVIEKANNIVRNTISAEDSETNDCIEKGFFTTDDFSDIIESSVSSIK